MYILLYFDFIFLFLIFFLFSWFFVGQKWVITKLKLKTKILSILGESYARVKKKQEKRRSNFFGNLLFKYLCYFGLGLDLTMGLSMMDKEHELYSSSNLKWQGISLQPILLRYCCESESYSCLTQLKRTAWFPVQIQ